MKRNKKRISWLSCFRIILLVVTIILLTLNIIQFIRLDEWVKEADFLEKRITELENNQLKNDDSIDLTYYYDLIDQKADSALNKVVVIVGVLVTIVTIFSGLIAFKAPSDIENELRKLEEQGNETRTIIEKSKISLAILDSNNKANTLEKISYLSSFIDEYNGKEEMLLEIYFTRGSFYDDIKEYTNARSDYSKAHKLGLDNFRFYNAMGVMYNKMLLSEKKSSVKIKEYFELAKKNYESAIRSSKKEAELSDVYCNYACLMGDYKQYDDAFRLFNMAKCENPDNYTVYLNEALTYENINKYSEALELYTRCIEKNQDYLDARKYRFDLVSKMLVKDLENESLKSYYKEDHDYLTKESRTLEIIENRYSQSFRKSMIDELISEIDAKIAELEKEELNENENDI